MRDFRGKLKLALDNIRSSDYVVKAGERLAQIVAFSGKAPRVHMVKDLDATQCGEGGFSSSDRAKEVSVSSASVPVGRVTADGDSESRN